MDDVGLVALPRLRAAIETATTPTSRFPRGWRVVVVATTLTAAVACAEDTSREPDRPAPSTSTATSAPPTSGTPAPTPSPTSDPGALPDAPSTTSPSDLADQLARALAALRAPDSSADLRQEAAEFHQLAVRALGTGPARFARDVVARLDAEDASLVRETSEAAGLLRGMTDPQKAFPKWRIVPPPSATELKRYYREAERRIGVPWTYLAAIHLVETRMGRIRGTSTAGAKGPMQFLPATWDRYGAGGDIEDPRDAVLAAARLLRANGAPGDMAGALWSYNHSESYVRAVTAYARTMQRSDWAYRSYWHWRVLYRHVRGTFVLPEGYPEVRPVRIPGE